MTNENNKTQSHKARFPVPDGPRVKTLDLKVTVNGQDLGLEVKRAFDLAKSSGQDLNLSFNCGTF